MLNKTLEKLGYNEWAKNIDAQNIPEDFSPARVIEVNKNRYMVSDGAHEMVAELSGKFQFDLEDATDFPTVGDWTAIQPLDNYSLAIIHSLLPRMTLLKRKP